MFCFALGEGVAVVAFGFGVVPGIMVDIMEGIMVDDVGLAREGSRT